MRARCGGEGGGAGAGGSKETQRQVQKVNLWCKGAGAVRWTVPVLGLNTTGESMTMLYERALRFPFMYI